MVFSGRVFLYGEFDYCKSSPRLRLEGINLANGGSWMQWVYGQPPGPKKSSSSAINGGSLDLR